MGYCYFITNSFQLDELCEYCSRIWFWNQFYTYFYQVLFASIAYIKAKIIVFLQCHWRRTGINKCSNTDSELSNQSKSAQRMRCLPILNFGRKYPRFYWLHKYHTIFLHSLTYHAVFFLHYSTKRNKRGGIFGFKSHPHREVPFYGE